MRPDAVIVGGGPAGAAAACLLARQGGGVVLFDRSAGPRDVVCGDFLSVEAQQVLARTGLDVSRLGAVPIGGVRLVRGRAVARAALPFAGVSLRRRVLDEALLRQAASYGADLRRGQAVRSVAGGEGGFRLDLADGQVKAGTVLLATGKHDLRGAARRAAPGATVGFKTYLRLADAQSADLAGHVEVILFPGGYAGLQPVDGGLTNLCLLVDRAALRRAGGDWAALWDWLTRHVPHLARRLAGAAETLPRPLSVARVPYGFVHRPGPLDPRGLWRLGDQAGVIPSFCGDGVAIALHSAALAAAVMGEGGDAASYHTRLRAGIAGPIRLASALDRMAATAAGRVLMTAVAALPPLLPLAARLTRIRGYDDRPAGRIPI